MVDYVQTCTNGIDLFGGAATVQWGNFNWGEEAWGTIAENLVISVSKTIAETASFTDLYTKDITTQYDNTLNLSDAYSKGFTLDTIMETIALSSDPSSEVLYEDDWQYVFTKPSTNAEDRSNTTWSEV